MVFAMKPKRAERYLDQTSGLRVVLSNKMQFPNQVYVMSTCVILQ